MTEYNGWTNWETWNSYNWISSYESTWKIAKTLSGYSDLDQFKQEIIQWGFINHDGIDPEKVNWAELKEALLED